MRRLFLLTLIFLGTAIGQTPQSEPSLTTSGVSNCRFWKMSPDDWRLGYLMAYHELIPAKDQPAGLDKYSRREVIDAITAVCAQPENAPLPVIFAIVVVGAKVTGIGPQQIEELLAKMRSDFAKESPKDNH